ncbi:MAG TPA: amino acid permease [Nannocystaceae bacterium]|nr:amino acid permease [Nannocystaceae bacterium]
MSENGHDSEDGLRRELGLFDTTAVVVGACVGVGIFFTPARVASLAGSVELALTAWVIGGLVALAGALTLAEIGSMYPKSGGQYAALRDAYGPGLAFVYVVCNATATQAGAIAVIGLVCAQNLAVATSGAELSPLGAAIVATALVVVLAIANAIGVRWGARIQNLTVIGKLAALAAVGMLVPFAPATVPEAAAVAPTDSTTTALLAALVPALFAFGGWQQATWVAGEVRDAERVLPRAILLGVVVIVSIYLAVNWAYLQLLGIDAAAASNSIAADATAVVLGEPGRRVVAAAVALSAFGVLNAQLLAGPRLVYALAADRRFFAVFARIDSRSGTPVAAIALLASVSLGLLWLAGAGGIDRLLNGVVAVDAIFFAVTGLTSVVLVRVRPRHTRPLRTPLWPIVPIAFTLAELAIVAGTWVDPNVRASVGVGAAWILAAAILYMLRFRGVR